MSTYSMEHVKGLFESVAGMIKIHENAIMKSHLSPGFTCFYFGLLRTLLHGINALVPTGKVNSNKKIMIFPPFFLRPSCCLWCIYFVRWIQCFPRRLRCAQIGVSDIKGEGNFLFMVLVVGMNKPWKAWQSWYTFMVRSPVFIIAPIGICEFIYYFMNCLLLWFLWWLWLLL